MTEADSLLTSIITKYFSRIDHTYNASDLTASGLCIIDGGSELKDIVGWDCPPQTRPVPAVRPPRPGRPRIYSRRIRRCRLPGIVRTGCFSPSGGAASINHAGTGIIGQIFGYAAMWLGVRYPQRRNQKARTAVDRFMCQQEGAVVTSSTARAFPHIPAERTKIASRTETEPHAMVTVRCGVSVSCDTTCGLTGCWL